MAGAETKVPRLDRWTIGDVEVTRVPEYEWFAHDFFPDATLEALRDHPWLFPDFAAPDGGLRFSVHALLVKAPTLKIVVDTCFGENKGLPHLAQLDDQGDLLAGLTAAGFPRASVDFVLCTHLHIDHVGWNTMLVDGEWVPTFPNARYLVGAKEYKYSCSDTEHLTRHGAPMLMRDSVTPVVAAGLVDFVSTDHRISPELRLIPTPGHTPGHVSVIIESQGERAVITGDMMHHPCQIAHSDWTNDFDYDRRQTVETRERMLAEWEASGALVIGTHFPLPTAGRIVTEGTKRRFRV